MPRGTLALAQDDGNLFGEGRKVRGSHTPERRGEENRPISKSKTAKAEEVSPKGRSMQYMPSLENDREDWMEMVGEIGVSTAGMRERPGLLE